MNFKTFRKFHCIYTKKVKNPDFCFALNYVCKINILKHKSRFLTFKGQFGYRTNLIFSFPILEENYIFEPINYFDCQFNFFLSI
mgnify:CR=1 FL=1